METVTLIADIQSNTNNTEAAFTTKLARPLKLPGFWRASIMDISYPHQWTTIHRDLPYAVLFPVRKGIGLPEYGHNSIIAPEQPIGLDEPSFVRTLKKNGLNQKETELFYDAKEINFLAKGADYELLTGTISEGEHTDPTTLVNQIKSTIEKLYRQQYPVASSIECDDIITYNPITRKVNFKYLEGSRYLIAAPADASIISMLGHGSRTTLIKTSSKREIQVLPVETDNSALSLERNRVPLPPIDKVNLRTLDNVFIYSDIIEQTLIGECQANTLGYFPIKSNFGETGYWCFNPPYDYKVIKGDFDTISIKLTQINGELFPFKNGKIIIRLLFKRV